MAQGHGVKRDFLKGPRASWVPSRLPSLAVQGGRPVGGVCGGADSPDFHWLPFLQCQTHLLQGRSPIGSIKVTPPMALSAVNVETDGSLCCEAWKQTPSPGALCLLEPLGRGLPCGRERQPAETETSRGWKSRVQVVFPK